MERKVREALALVRQGFGLREISELVETSTQRLKYWLRRYKVTEVVEKHPPTIVTLDAVCPIPNLNLYPLRGDEDGSDGH